MTGRIDMLSRWARRKTYGLEEVDAVASHSGGGPATLAKVLNTFDLTLLGVGSTLGVGIYVLAGSVALNTAGPAVCLSFLVAAIASAFAAMSYAEFGARVPKAGSAYIYSYVTVGEIIAFIIGWNLILEYLIGTASVARAFSANLDALTNKTMSAWFSDTFPMNANGLADYFDLFCFLITLALAVLLGLGVRSSAIFTNIFTFVNVTVVVFVIVGGSILADPANWRIPESDVPEGFGVGGFFPYGFSGVMAGAATCFFAFVGFDSIASTGEEAKNAKRSIPLSINLTLVIVFIAYFAVSTVITLMWPYYLQDPDTPLVYAFQQNGWNIAANTISIGSLFGLAASLLGAMIPLPRIIYAKAKDGLVFRFLGQVNPRFQTPVIATALSGIMAAVLGAIFDLESLVDMMSIGTLLAYTLVAVSVLILRYEEAEQAAIAENGEAASRLKMPWNRIPTKKSSRNAVYATVVYCLLTIAFCGVLVGMENNSDPWLLFGIGICFGPMLMVMLYLGMLPRSRTPLYFKVPGVPIVPCLSVIINTYLMFKLNINTWIRFGVWMALGFVMYFGYGMWNSSEEYVRKGKIPPGGTAPLPTAATTPAAGTTASGPADDVESGFSKTAMMTRAIPITSLDDDLAKPTTVEAAKTGSTQDENDESGNFMAAIQESHLVAQDAFDQARRARLKTAEALLEAQLEADRAREAQQQMAVVQQMIIETHLATEQVFRELREQKIAEGEEMKKQMVVFASQMKELDEELSALFKRPVPANRASKRTAPPSGPMTAVMQELINKSKPIDGEDEEATAVDSTVDANTVAAADGAIASSADPNIRKSPNNNLSPNPMLAELKMAFDRAGHEDDANISPSAIQHATSSEESPSTAFPEDREPAPAVAAEQPKQNS